MTKPPIRHHTQAQHKQFHKAAAAASHLADLNPVAHVAKKAAMYAIAEQRHKLHESHTLCNTCNKPPHQPVRVYTSGKESAVKCKTCVHGDDKQVPRLQQCPHCPHVMDADHHPTIVAHLHVCVSATHTCTNTPHGCLFVGTNAALVAHEQVCIAVLPLCRTCKLHVLPKHDCKTELVEAVLKVLKGTQADDSDVHKLLNLLQWLSTQ